MTVLQIDVTVSGPAGVATGSATVDVEDAPPGAGDTVQMVQRSTQMRWGGSRA